jgi:hypothetical protein
VAAISVFLIAKCWFSENSPHAMTPRSAATIALRIVALLIMIWALSDFTTLAYLFLSSHLAAHAANPIIAPSFDRTQVASPINGFLWSMSPLILLRFVGGLLLFPLSKPLGKLVARGLE